MRLLAAGLLFASFAAAQPPAGLWDATLAVNNLEIPFRFEISGAAPNLRGNFFNGDEKISSTGGKFADSTLVLTFDQYASKLEALWKDGALDGKYERSNRTYAFRAVPAAARPAAAETAPSIGGQWEFAASSSKGESAWRLIVRQSGAHVTAAILRVDGDTGALEGTYRDGKFVLSHFDGARPMLLEVTPAADGTLELIQNGRQKYTAVRAGEARARNMPAPTDPATHTSVKDASEPFHFSFRDLNGNLVSDTDSRFRDKVVIVAIGGSWCPNCHDEAPFLEDLYRKYHARGLEIVGLFFEDSDQLKDPARVRAFVKQYGIEYPMLLAGETGELHDKVPQAVNLDCWPTTFFLGRDGRVRAVHAGYAAPASGVYHAELEKDVNELLERLLNETYTAER
ncbi:MAG TPA: TlpA disulfide reductase family protein [Bryobacteraceae bacterium]|nr:TlpA disulfide reductase family protein [Bryobacteraceae bacterium]